MPYYLIHDTVTAADDRLVKAKNASAALSYVVGTRWTTKTVGIDELAHLLTIDGRPLEVASDAAVAEAQAEAEHPGSTTAEGPIDASSIDPAEAPF